jgi:hypothetical protein
VARVDRRFMSSPPHSAMDVVGEWTGGADLECDNDRYWDNPSKQQGLRRAKS